MTGNEKARLVLPDYVPPPAPATADRLIGAQGAEKPATLLRPFSLAPLVGKGAGRASSIPPSASSDNENSHDCARRDAWRTCAPPESMTGQAVREEWNPMLLKELRQ